MKSARKVFSVIMKITPFPKSYPQLTNPFIQITLETTKLGASHKALRKATYTFAF